MTIMTGSSSTRRTILYRRNSRNHRKMLSMALSQLQDNYAERAIRPQTIQRKGSLFFDSVQGALRSAKYNPFIQTCKQVGVLFRQYFKALFKAVKSGRTDYENLLPMTILLELMKFLVKEN
ncbi:IS66 family transposase [Segatella bryantii]|uniref:IS66 family transposase n=1 Tax=Segatella bryantii TaxID=77095 RepID=UPI00293F5D92|nr:transposase [Segatella bryantii]